MSNDSTLYTVGDVARRFAVTVRTLRHWEALGLLSPAQRSWSNYRLYSAGDCARPEDHHLPSDGDETDGH